MARLAKTASTDAEAAPPGTLAVQRALTVMKCFQEGELERRLSSIARDTGLSVSTTHRLLAALCEEGFLRQDPDTERYSIGPTLALLGQRSASAAGLDLAQSVLAGLTRRTGESSTLAIRSGGEALVIAVSSSAQRLRFDHGVGTRLPLHASAMGKVLLACADTDVAAQARSLGPLERFTGHTITSKAALTAELRGVREQSWAVNVEERYVGVAGVAAPVADAAGRTIAAIGVQGPSGRIDVTPESQLVIAVRDAANGLTGRLVAERFG